MLEDGLGHKCHVAEGSTGGTLTEHSSQGRRIKNAQLLPHSLNVESVRASLRTAMHVVSFYLRSSKVQNNRFKAAMGTTQAVLTIMRPCVI